MSTAAQTRPTFEETLALVSSVEGWMTDAQARRLWDAASAVPAGGIIVEIGSFRGRSMIVLAHAADPSVELVALDPHMGGDRGPNEYDPDDALGDADYDTFHANLRAAGVDDRVRHVRALSAEALGEVQGELDLLYVDGAHRYAFAKPDIEQWGNRVRDGGHMLIHDCFNAVGVMLAQIRLLFASRRWRYVGRSGSLAQYRRTHLTTRGVAGNLLEQAAGIRYFVRNCVVKALIVARLRPVARLLGEHGHWPY